MDEVTGNKTGGIDHSLLPENTLTIIMKVNGKVFGHGAQLGNITRGMPDEDINSTLRAIRGLTLSCLRRLAELAGKPFDYELPKAAIEEEEDDGPELIMMLADEDIKKGDPVVVDVGLGRARNATSEEVERTDEKPVQ